MGGWEMFSALDMPIAVTLLLPSIAMYIHVQITHLYSLILRNLQNFCWILHLMYRLTQEAWPFETADFE